jgi:hypothetical protein
MRWFIVVCNEVVFFSQHTRYNRAMDHYNCCSVWYQKHSVHLWRQLLAMHTLFHSRCLTIVDQLEMSTQLLFTVGNRCQYGGR